MDAGHSDIPHSHRLTQGLCGFPGRSLGVDGHWLPLALQNDVDRVSDRIIQVGTQSLMMTFGRPSCRDSGAPIKHIARETRGSWVLKLKAWIHATHIWASADLRFGGPNLRIMRESKIRESNADPHGDVKHLRIHV